MGGRFLDFLRTLHWPHWATRAVIWSVGVVVALGVIGTGTFFFALWLYEPSLSFKSDLYALNRPPAFIFEDAKGRTIGRRGAVIGERLKLGDMPRVSAGRVSSPWRTAASTNTAASITAACCARCMSTSPRGHFAQGGSTITQQLVKTIFLTPEKTLSRKLEEMAAARELETILTKDQILELYLNRIYLGSGAYGVDGAARTYFGKSARRVTLAEAAMLASLTRGAKRVLAAARSGRGPGARQPRAGSDGRDRRGFRRSRRRRAGASRDRVRPDAQRRAQLFLRHRRR